MGFHVSKVVTVFVRNPYAVHMSVTDITKANLTLVTITDLQAHHTAMAIPSRSCLGYPLIRKHS